MGNPVVFRLNYLKQLSSFLFLIFARIFAHILQAQLDKITISRLEMASNGMLFFF